MCSLLACYLFLTLFPPASVNALLLNSQSNNFFAALDDSGDEAPASKNNKKVAIKKEPEKPKPVAEAPKKDAGYVELFVIVA